MRLRLVIAISATLLMPTAQSQTLPDANQATPTLAALSDPKYPPLARQARILGEVHLQIRLRKDGTVESAEAVSGHPMLSQSALESAKQSTFRCADCSDEGKWYSLAYSFEIRDGCHFGPHCEPLEVDKTIVQQFPGRVVISVPPLCTCDPPATLVKIRSAKCIYLWRCGQREVPDQ